MKQVTIDGKNYTAECGEDGRIVLTPVPELPEPNKDGWFIDGCGDVCPDAARASDEDYNVFRSEEFALEQVAPSLRAFFAMWQVKERVEPGFVPDWNNGAQEKHSIFFDREKGAWVRYYWNTRDYNTPAFSTAEKCDRAIEILNHWGVRP